MANDIETCDTEKVLLRLDRILETLSESKGSNQPEGFPKAKDRKVFCDVRCSVISVGEIDTVTQQFEADVFVSFKYFEGKQNKIAANNSEHDGLWDPRVNFLNAVTIQEKERRNDTNVFGKGTIYRYLSLRMNGTFKTPMKLQNFPCDFQVMTIKVSSSWPIDKLQFRRRTNKYGKISDNINIDAFTGCNEWDLQEHVVTEVKQPDLTKDKKVYSTYLIKLHAQRKPLFYVWNVVLPVFCILALSFTSFVIDAENPSDRLSVTVTMLLTAVAFKSAVSSMLPKIPYLTLLDKYVLCNFILQCLMVAQNAVAALCAKENKCPHFDLWSIIVLAFIAIVVNVGFIIAGIILFIKAKRDLGLLTRKYKDERACLDPTHLPHHVNIQENFPPESNKVEDAVRSMV
ncbi:Glycine receptor subunit alpha-3 [Holothuria leucospilota]|uniref:Glycine receptor subunit alpha-3 n=1 Tax=Holothuria leucospilota TaxID=206669 RepID=A0A9Q1H9R7_HOLLE|nr:Glycine receptor subunit alpha-3 [Holothuria leucospilota]